MAGYSDTPLLKKLGIKDDSHVAVIGFPLRGPEELSVYSETLQPDLNVIVFFTKSSEELENAFPNLIASTVQNGSIWISWPKKSSGVFTDLVENHVRDIGLAAGVVDVKVCAVDEVWSGLKFVRRIKDRL